VTHDGSDSGPATAPASGAALVPDRIAKVGADEPSDRVVVYVGVVLGTFAGLLLFRVLLTPFLHRDGYRALFTRPVLTHVIAVALLAVGFVVGRRAKAARTRAIVELFATLLFPAAGLVELPRYAPVSRPDLALLIGAILVLVTRAALVPSTPLRTAAIGLAVIAPLLAVVPVLYSGASGVDGVSLQAASTGGIVALGGAAVAVTSIISRVIYGLRRQVRDVLNLGQYRLVHEIGRGGMGTVYEARHALLRRRTAVKLVQESNAGPANLERFEREARLTSELSHPNTVTVFDFGRTREGVLYYAMELISGRTLRELVELTGPMPPARALHVLKAIAGSVGEAHAAGLVHRDLKPENVMLCERAGTKDFVKVLDFGLVKPWHNPDVGGPTNANAVVGTPHFMAPETLVSNGVTPAADVYAIGVCAYFLLTNTLPFEGSTVVAVAMAHLRDEAAPLSLRSPHPVPADLERVIVRCLEKKPEDRYANGDELLAALDGCSDVGSWTPRDAAREWLKVSSQGERPVRQAVTEPLAPMKTS
jgi:eukaryotic-like serine/threonine-protein kinase